MDQVKPKNYLVESILATILCCLPFGIVGIIKASQVNTKYAEGDFEGAEKASASAKKWMIWSIVAGVIVFVLAFVLPFLIFGAAFWDSFTEQM